MISDSPKNICCQHITDEPSEYYNIFQCYINRKNKNTGNMDLTESRCYMIPLCGMVEDPDHPYT